MRMLRWHYRSRHQSLIAVSNRQFYENKLYIVPSPFTAQAGLGLRFHHIADGVFETGTTRTNPVEARAVARAIIEHAVNSPELSLGVVAFSAAQRRAILDQLEILRRQLPAEHEAYFQAHPAEPFFIKNLENVQGDERDVIFISVGYGPTTLGHKPPMRFGPLGQEGGERRLNVLISRAIASNGLSGTRIREISGDLFQIEEEKVSSRFSTMGGDRRHRSARQDAEELILTLRPR